MIHTVNNKIIVQCKIHTIKQQTPTSNHKLQIKNLKTRQIAYKLNLRGTGGQHNHIFELDLRNNQLVSKNTELDLSKMPSQINCNYMERVRERVREIWGRD